MVISNKYNFIYLQTKKTGSISLSLALGQIADPRTDIIYRFSSHWKLQSELGIKANAWKRKVKGIQYKVDAHAEWKKIFNLVDDPNDYFKFTVERNPWDKVVSMYYYLLNSGHNKSKQYQLRTMDFEKYIKRTRFWKIANNWRLYTNKHDEIMVDYVCRYEKLNEDLKRVEREIGAKFIHLIQKRANVGYRKVKDYRSMYTNETKNIVGDFFKKEIEHFGYEF